MFVTSLNIEEAAIGFPGKYRGIWRLTASLIYKNSRINIVVPVNFTTDFASVPRIFWPLFPPYGKYTKASVVHDWLYASKWMDRRDADALFREIMREAGVAAWRRWTMWAAVRLFGKKAYLARTWFSKYTDVYAEKNPAEL